MRVVRAAFCCPPFIPALFVPLPRGNLHSISMFPSCFLSTSNSTPKREKSRPQYSATIPHLFLVRIPASHMRVHILSEERLRTCITFVHSVRMRKRNCKKHGKKERPNRYSVKRSLFDCVYTVIFYTISQIE